MSGEVTQSRSESNIAILVGGLSDGSGGSITFCWEGWSETVKER